MAFVVYAICLLTIFAGEAEGDSRSFHFSKKRTGMKADAGSANATSMLESHEGSLLSCTRQCSEVASNAVNYRRTGGNCECLNVEYGFIEFSVDSDWSYYELDAVERDGDRVETSTLMTLSTTPTTLTTLSDREPSKNYQSIYSRLYDIILATFNVIPRLDCLTGYKYIDGSNSCYRIDGSVVPVNLTEADTICSGNATSLLKLETTTEADSVAAHLASIIPNHLVNGWSFVGSDDSYVRSDVAASNIPTVEFTIIMWMKIIRPSQTTRAHVVSYATMYEDNQLLVWFDIEDDWCYLSLNGDYFYARMPSEYINIWFHFSLTWQSSTGSTKLYWDGKLEGEEPWPLAQGTTVPMGGAFLLGQDQDSLLGGFSVTDSFNGQLRNFHLFATALPESVIRAIYLGDDVRCGDVVGCDPATFILVGDNVQNDVPDGKPRYWLNSVATSDSGWTWRDTNEPITHLAALPVPAVTGNGLTVAHDLVLQGRRSLDDMNYICEQDLG